MEASVDAAIEALARTQHGAFNVLQATNLGATSSLLGRRAAAGRWIRVAPRVYVLTGWPATFEQRLMVACLGAKTGAFVSHRAAAVIRKFDGIAEAPVEVTLPHGIHYPRRDVVVHRTNDLTKSEWEFIGRIPVTSATRTIVDLASVCSLEVVERAFESAVRRGLSSVADLDAAVARVGRSGRPGIANARRLLDLLVRDGQRNGSDLETLFLQLLRAHGIRLPVRQQCVLRPDGRLAFADYAYADRRAIIELEGFESHSTKQQHRSDIERNNHLVLQGWLVLRFNWTQVTTDPEYVVRMVLAALNRVLV